MEQKLSFQNWFLRESVIQGCQMVEFKGQIPIFSYLINNLHFCFTNLTFFLNVGTPKESIFLTTFYGLFHIVGTTWYTSIARGESRVP